MKRKTSPVRDLAALFRRTVQTNPRNKQAFFLLLLVVNMVLFGFYGIYPGYKALLLKTSLRTEYSQVQKTLSENLVSLSSMELYLQDESLLDYINSAVPTIKDISNYLVSVVKVGAQHGFYLKSFSVLEQSKPNVVSISVVFVGALNQAAELVDGIETQSRLSSVNQVFVVADEQEESVQVTVGLDVYYLQNLLQIGGVDEN